MAAQGAVRRELESTWAAHVSTAFDIGAGEVDDVSIEPRSSAVGGVAYGVPGGVVAEVREALQ